MSILRDGLSVCADLLLGAGCPGCDLPGIGLCVRCRDRLASTQPLHTVPTPCPAGFPTTVTAGPYDELLHRLIPAHKERQAWLLTAALGEQLCRAVELLLSSRSSPIGPTGMPVILVPVPSSQAAVRARGRDATAAIAGAAARRLRDPSGRSPGRALGTSVTVRRLLRPVRRLADQSDLSADQRRTNLAGAYAVPSGRIPREPVGVVLVDDLVTTGSSLTEAHRAVLAAGLPVLGAGVVAAAIRRHPGRPNR